MKYNHYEYSEYIARRLKAIGHTDDNRKFFKVTQQDSLNSLEERISSVSGTILIAVDGSSSEYAWAHSDSLVKKPSYGMMIVKDTNSNDSRTIHHAQKECELLAEQVLARMLQNADNYEWGLHLMKIDSAIIEGIGPVSDNFYGVMFSFSLEYGMNYLLNNEMWEDSI